VNSVEKKIPSKYKNVIDFAQKINKVKSPKYLADIVIEASIQRKTSQSNKFL
jgi:hypothetical protein